MFTARLIKSIGHPAKPSSSPGMDESDNSNLNLNFNFNFNFNYLS